MVSQPQCQTPQQQQQQMQQETESIQHLHTASIVAAASDSGNEMLALVGALETALLPCLPARELQAIDRSAHPSHQIDVERHARDFMEAAKKLQLYFIHLQHQSQPNREDSLKKEIDLLEEELKAKDNLIHQQKKLIQEWKDLLMRQRAAHITELERV